MNYKLLNDARLVELVKADDRLAFKEIYLWYWKEMFNLCRRKANDPVIAEEIIQNVFISLWHNRNSSEIRQLKNYLYVALNYGCINNVKRQIVAKRYFEYKKDAYVAYSNSTEEAFALKELSSKIDEGIGFLPEKTGKMFRMSRYKKRSVKEISDYFGLTEKAVEYHITLSIKKLRILLKDYILVFIWVLIKFIFFF